MWESLRRSTKQLCVTECQFADDVATLASTRHSAEVAILQSSKAPQLLVTGYDIGEEDTAHIVVGNDEIECIKELTYLVHSSISDKLALVRPPLCT